MGRNSLPVVCVCCILFSLVSCDKFEGDQSVPAYISIDTFFLKPNTQLNEGMLTHQITDVWVFADDDLLGAFELPAIIPVLKNGKHKITLAPGIKFNAMSGTRGPYPFMQPYINTGFDFVTDSVIIIAPQVSYYDNTIFLWIEDFEDGSISFEATTNSDTTLQLVQHDVPKPGLGSYFGKGVLTLNKGILELATNVSDGGGYTFTPGSPVFLEIDFRTNTHFVIGMYITKIAEVIMHPVFVGNPTDERWRKIYVNFTPALQANSGALYFNVFLRMDNDGSAMRELEIDNIKLVNKPESQ